MQKKSFQIKEQEFKICYYFVFQVFKFRKKKIKKSLSIFRPSNSLNFFKFHNEYAITKNNYLDSCAKKSTCDDSFYFYFILKK